ncbi:amino acid adenylation domain-containing protein [Nocardia sp. CDC159]|uniref:Amino acid adenylation domain-containing protein n=1 Tax=Nocardia pulmonis TaxID=2951408 RepID=A0A9X2E5F3_9NOCA|nr:MULTISPECIES: amino acid adenylation domain-containing protein [Nocardia]MCM6773976.1 amino acid adenylation domain-containing protein [Nocardia pulmonis]MCM6786863.1 amino acid adenylation domain-containing protein [Nocardia sp. CDC159]
MATPTKLESLDDVLTKAALNSPDTVALSDTQHTLTYEQLRFRTAAVAKRLTDQGVRKGDLVGLLAERTLDVVVGMIAILRCGAAYVPIDPTYPVDRQNYIVADSGTGFVVGSTAALAKTELPAAIRIYNLDTPIAPGDPTDAPVAVGPGDPAYVIYTSGSTGAPKGCVVTHGNVLGLLDNALPLFAVGPEDCWSIFHSFSFDVSVWELWAPLAVGAKAVVVPHDATQVPASLVRVLTEERVTVLSQVPSVFRQFTSLTRYPAEQLRYIIFAGESIDLGAVRRFWAQCEGHRPTVINMYGPTETTVYCTFRQITEADPDGVVRSPIGVPLPHLTIELRGAEPPHRPVADGEIGEMWVSGPGVTCGYLNRAELTAQRFVWDDSSGAKTRYYRTGDLARRLPDGGLEYLGRNDDQIKLRGYRIELGEIEAVLRAQPGVLDAALCVVPRRIGSPLLTACLVADGDQAEQDALAEAVRTALAERLPKYMLPDRYVYLTSLPLTLSGKLDRNRLTELATQAVANRTAAGAPSR